MSLIGCGSLDYCGNWYRAGIAAALGDDARAVSLLPPNFGTTGTAHRSVLGEMLQHYAPFLELVKPRGGWSRARLQAEWGGGT